MKQKRRIVLLHWIVCMWAFTLPVLAVCQKGKTTAEKDPAAKVVLDKLKQQYAAYKSMEVTFELEIELPGQAKQSQKGTMIQQKNQFQIKMTEQEIYSDGKTTWMYLKKNKEVQILDAAETDAAGIISPKDMMDMYEKDKFSYVVSDERAVKGKQYVDIEFKPLDKFADYSKLRMTVDKSSNKMISLRVFSKDGSRFTLTMSNLVTNKTYASSTFVLNTAALKGVHVEDLRMND